jgi:preprotein translocase subunit SecE
MELTRKILIITAALVILFVAFTLRMWVLGDRQHSFKKELISSFIAVLVFAVIVVIIFHINN